MKFQLDSGGSNLIQRQEPGRVWVAADAYAHSIVVPWQGAVVDWLLDGFDALTPEHFERIATLDPEVVIFGSGARLRFPKPALLRPLIERGIGVETMDTAAACRTYNVLVSEQRSAVAALLVEPADQPIMRADL